jgi:hypothetical protein
MKRCTTLRLLLALVLGLLMSTVGTQRARAEGDPDMPNLLGHWSGILQNADNGFLGELSFIADPTGVGAEANSRAADLRDVKVSTQTGTWNVKHGHMEVVGHDNTSNVKNDQREGVGHNNTLRVDGRILVTDADDSKVVIGFHGKVFDLGNGTLGLHASYRIGPPGNPIDSGSLICVQSFGGEAWKNVLAPNVTGCWMGSFVTRNSTIPMAALFSSEAGSSLAGDLTIVRDYAFVGTISADGSIQGMALGPVPTVQYVSISARFFPATGLAAAHISGTLHFVFVGGATEDDAFSLQPCSFEDF